MKYFLLSSFLLGLLSIVGAHTAYGQTAEVQTSAEDEQNETFRDTLVRMRIKREEEEHKKTVAKAEQIKTNAAELLKTVEQTFLPRSADKLLKEIEKNARNVRSDLGGGDDAPLDELPENLAAALKRLYETSERLNKQVSKTSRHVVSYTACAEASEIIQLVKLLRTYLH